MMNCSKTQQCGLNTGGVVALVRSPNYRTIICRYYQVVGHESQEICVASEMLYRCSGSNSYRYLSTVFVQIAEHYIEKLFTCILGYEEM
jgi:hypothetical protein